MYPKHTKDICLDIAVVPRSERSISLRAFTRQPHAPSKTTVYRWQQEAQQANSSPKLPMRKGPPPKLSEGESQVVIGWLLQRRLKKKRVSGKSVIDFTKRAFGVSITKSTVTRLLNKKHITAHIGRHRDKKYLRPHLVRTLLAYGLQLRRDLATLPDSRKVTVDVCKFSSYGKLLRTYAPEGTYLTFSFTTQNIN